MENQLERQTRILTDWLKFMNELDPRFETIAKHYFRNRKELRNLSNKTF